MRACISSLPVVSTASSCLNFRYRGMKYFFSIFFSLPFFVQHFSYISIIGSSIESSLFPHRGARIRPSQSSLFLRVETYWLRYTPSTNFSRSHPRSQVPTDTWPSLTSRRGSSLLHTRHAHLTVLHPCSCPFFTSVLWVDIVSTTVTALAFSPCPSLRILAAGSWDGGIHLYREVRNRPSKSTKLPPYTSQREGEAVWDYSSAGFAYEGIVDPTGRFPGAFVAWDPLSGLLFHSTNENHSLVATDVCAGVTSHTLHHLPTIKGSPILSFCSCLDSFGKELLSRVVVLFSLTIILKILLFEVFLLNHCLFSPIIPFMVNSGSQNPSSPSPPQISLLPSLLMCTFQTLRLFLTHQTLSYTPIF